MASTGQVTRTHLITGDRVLGTASKPPKNCSLARGVEGKGVGCSEAQNRLEREGCYARGAQTLGLLSTAGEGKQEVDMGSRERAKWTDERRCHMGTAPK